MNKGGTLRERLQSGFIRHFLGHEIWALGDQAIVSASNFLTNVMLARFMGLREFGIFVLAWMSVVFVNSLQTALIVAPMTSIGPKQREEDRPSYFGTRPAKPLKSDEGEGDPSLPAHRLERHDDT